MHREKLLLWSCAMVFVCASVGLYRMAKNSNAHFDLDSYSYERIGRHYAQTNQLFDPSYLDDTQVAVIPVQTLGYPFFLGMVYKILGYHIVSLVIVQVVLSLFALYMLYCIAVRLFDRSIALMVAVLGSINFGFLVYSQFVLTEILLTTLLVAGLERLTKFFTTGSSGALGQSAFLYGISVAVKPVALFYIFIVLVFVMLWLLEHRRTILKPVIFFLCCFYAPVLLYMAHNKLRFGVFAVAPVMHENIYRYFLAKLIAQDKHVSIKEGLKRVDVLINEKDHNDPMRWNEPKKVMRTFLFERPLFVIKVWLLNVLKTFVAPYSSQLKFLIAPELKGTETSFFSKTGLLADRFYHYLVDGIDNRLVQTIALWQAAWIILQYVLLALAFIVLVRQRQYFLVAFFTSSICYFTFITGHDGCARYRMMIEPTFILFTAFALVVVWNWLLAYRERFFRVGSSLLKGH